MRSLPRRASIGTVLVALALLVSACGGADESTLEAPVSTGAGAAAATSATDLRSLTIDVRRDPG